MNGGCYTDGKCYFWRYREGKGRPTVKLIRQVCLWCQGDRADLVRECHEKDCALHLYRMGTNPKRAGIGGNFAGTDTVNRGFAA